MQFVSFIEISEVLCTLHQSFNVTRQKLAKSAITIAIMRQKQTLWHYILMEYSIVEISKSIEHIFNLKSGSVPDGI